MTNFVDLTDDPAEVSDLEEVAVVRLPQRDPPPGHDDVEIVSSRRIPRHQRRLRPPPPRQPGADHFDDMPSLGGPRGVRDLFVSDYATPTAAELRQLFAGAYERPFERANAFFPHPSSNHLRFLIPNFGPPGHGLPGPEDERENSMLQHVLAHSLHDTHNHDSVDWRKIKKPEMGPVTEGFTRDLNSPATLACPRCERELGTGNEQQQKVFYRTCGHVYCGECVAGFKELKGKKRQCVANGCRTKKKVVFKQIYF